MAQLISPTTGATQEVSQTFKAGLVTVRPEELLGSYLFSATSGLITLINAKTATAGQVFQLRNGHTSTLMLIKYLRLRWQTVTAFTTAQRIGLQAFMARSFTVNGSGGTAISSVGAGQFKKRLTMPTSACLSSGDARIATTDDLTSGTHTLDAQPFFELNGWSQTAAAPSVMPVIETELNMQDGNTYPLILAQNEGFIIASSLLMGAAGTAVVSVDIQWDEVSSY